MDVKPAVTPERQAFYERIGSLDLAPLWEVYGALVRSEPKPASRPAIWRYEEVRPLIEEAGRIISAEEAERRVLVLENPGLKGQSRITESLFAGLQFILPGEVAPSHRHTQSALRFIVEGQGAYTAVGGEKTTMSPGDFVLTPSWTWHHHGNQSDEPMVWLDGLDIPLVALMNATFGEAGGEDSHKLARPEGDALARYGSGLLPVDYDSGELASPAFTYPYERTREALETMRGAEAWDPCHGLKMRYVNPASGGHAMPTIGAFMQLLPKGFETAPYRSTDGTVYSVVEGRGRTVAGEEPLAWRPGDTFVIPSWVRHYHSAEEDAVLFSFSDRPAQEKLGLWREHRGNR